MTTANTGEVWQLTLEGSQEGQQVMNILVFRAVTPTDNVELRLMRALVECFLLQLVPAMAETYTFVRCLGKRVSPDLGPVVEIGPETGDIIAGNAGGDSTATFTSALVSIQTTRGGRTGRGRMFIPGVPESATLNSFLNIEDPFWTALLAYLACVTAKFITSADPPPANHWDLGIMSRKIGGVKPPFLPNGFAPATRLIPKRQLATTNSRKIGHGR